MMSELCKVEELIFGEWSETTIRNLRPGVIFRMFEENGDKKNNKVWIAKGNPYLWMGYWMITKEPRK